MSLASIWCRTLFCLIILISCLPVSGLAQDPEFQSFNREETPKAKPLQEFAPWSIGIAGGRSYPSNDFLRGSSDGFLFQIGLRLKASNTRHFNFRYSRALLEVTNSMSRDGHFLQYDVTQNQYHFLHGWHGNRGFTSSSWTYFEVGPAILHYTSDPEGREDVSAALSLSLGMLIPLGTNADLEWGFSALVNLIDPNFGRQWGTMGQVYLGLQFH